MTTSAAFTTPFLFLCLFCPLKPPHTSHTCRFSGGVHTSSNHTHWFFFPDGCFISSTHIPLPLSLPLSSPFSSPFALFSDDTSCFTGDGGEVGVERQQYSWCLKIFVPVVLCFNLVVYYYISIVSCEFTLDNQSPALMGVLGLILLMSVFLFPTKCWVFSSCNPYFHHYASPNPTCCTLKRNKPRIPFGICEMALIRLKLWVILGLGVLLVVLCVIY